ncbi:hypothetical protein EYV94_10735 [Puteibacter caeruleilacunae]|nr:hypothetical protein EYV94_10735 [Puteibacter caeruleilacunae]
MKRKVNIELFDEYEKVNFYTLQFEGEDSEADKFLDKFPVGCGYDDDIDILIKWIEKIGERGALERYFRYEGKEKDNVMAIPIETTSLRLYVIRLSENIIVLGNGGVKKTRTYNEDKHLKQCVELLQNIDGLIRTRMRSDKIVLYDKKLLGNLTFNV